MATDHHTGSTPAAPDDVADTVAQALAEDSHNTDRHARLIDPRMSLSADIIARGRSSLAGQPWVDATFAALDTDLKIDWQLADGARTRAAQPVCRLHGAAAALAGGAHTALSFLGLLSGVATITVDYVERVKGTGASIAATQHTLPGLRNAQYYAVRCGGGRGAADNSWLIEPGHARAAGGLAAAIARARSVDPDLFVRVTTDSLTSLEIALEAGADGVCLTNLPSHVLAKAVNMADAHRRRFRTHLLIEAAGTGGLASVREIADTGVDRIAVSALTRSVRAADFELRLA